MGLYDTIKCKYSLPMPDDPKGYSGSEYFQTKDLDCSLGYYEIREDGNLWAEHREAEYIAGDPKGKTLLEKLGRMETKKRWFELDYFHGTIEMYDYIDHDNSKDFDYFISYEIQFDKGTVKNIRLLNFEATPNQKRKERDKEFNEKMRKSYEFRQTKKYKYIYGPYNKAIKYIFRKLYTFSNKIPSLILNLENKLQL
jgi:hypothetical protein